MDDAVPELSRARVRLQQELQRARELAGLSGYTIAERVGTSQGTVWRFEHGRALLALPKIEAWLAAAGVTGSERTRLLDLAEQVHAETRPWRDLLEGADHLQEAARQREQETALAQNFQPTVVPGLLQTPEYARRVFELGKTRDVAAAVAGRIERQQIIYGETARFEFMLAERALRADFGQPAVLAAQCDRVISLAKLESVTVTVVPEGAAVLPWHNFIIWTNDEGGRYVTTELVHGAQELHDDRDLATYLDLWERLWSAAAVGDDAVALIRSPG